MRGLVSIRPAFVPPNANCRSRFHVDFLEDVLHVLVDRAKAAPKNFSDLAVAFASRDPFGDFKLAFGQRG